MRTADHDRNIGIDFFDLCRNVGTQMEERRVSGEADNVWILIDYHSRQSLFIQAEHLAVNYDGLVPSLLHDGSEQGQVKRRPCRISFCEVAE